ncbi:ferrochelatase [Roseisolibacter sp. H3M3-2]|uniref:ferrochelatase n=1 Tax=Roseisolibacter sp. H3M3-2 TaxID=3031323 RepID=UPI0023DBAB70|nr:ferrochelatase [Roseisolibacter sp. H3M3-2]MDF1502400.1 ferrochelatase [Roseisolibacter sp. H3M3-2]
MSDTTGRTGLLLLAYGTPETPERVEEYFTHIRGGRAPSPESVAHLRHRYEAVGGRTPLTALTEAVRDGVARGLAARGHDVPVYVGMKHWEPWIADVVKRMADDGIARVVCVVLAPHYSRFSVGGYQRYLFEGMHTHGVTMDVDFVEQWHDDPGFVDVIATLVNEELAHWPAGKRDDVTVIFSAHSLPERIRTWGDPYEAQLETSARLIAEKAGLNGYRRAWQSAGNTGEPWIGPDILDFLPQLADEGVTDVLQCAVGFVCDHLEILYDLDIEAQQKAGELGITYRRTRLPNARPDFVAALTDICERAVRGENVVRVDTPPPTTRRRDELAEGASPIHAEGRPAGAAH